MEQKFSAGAQVDISEIAKASVGKENVFTEQERLEVNYRGQQVVNEIQLVKLNTLFEALDTDILVDREKPCYVVIDQLDEDWVDDETRYRLIRALVETMREVNSEVENLKVVVALRSDLFDRVLVATADSGFQDEKYRDLCLQVEWNKTELKTVLDRRIDQMVKHVYTDQKITYKDLLPNTLGSSKQSTIEFMLERTLMRPRDIINFMNICIQRAEGFENISSQIVRAAEATYSQQRLRSICDEWSVQYPLVREFLSLFSNGPSTSRLCELKRSDLDDLCIIGLTLGSPLGWHDQPLRRYYEENDKSGAAINLRRHIAWVLFQIGSVGLKIETYQRVAWSDGSSATISEAEINEDCRIHIHKMFWRTLGIRPS